MKADGVYARVTDGVDHPYQPLAKDDLRTSRRVQPAKEFAQDWPILWTARPNVLVVGRADAVEQSLAAFTPHLDPPVCYWTPGAVLPSPGDVKTLVIRSVDALSAEQQRDVSSWLEQAAGERTPVVSTTPVPLFQRMVAGLFLDVLYYRLNTVVLDARATAGPDLPHPHPAKADLRAERRAEAS